MNYGLLETEIAQRLNNKFAEDGLGEYFVAAEMPETDKEMKEFEAQIIKSRVAVEYIDSTFDNPSDLGCVRQAETAKFRLLFDGKKMRGEFGLFSLMSKAKKYLLGYRLTNMDPITLSAYGKTQFEPGVWIPHIDIEVRGMNVQVVEYSDAIGGPFASIEDAPEGMSNEFNNNSFA